MKKIANFVSTLLHPIFAPFIGFFLLLSSSSIILIQREEVKTVLLQSIFIITIAIPLLSVLILKWSGVISSIRIPIAKERKIPYIITFSSYLFLGLFFRQFVYIPNEISIIFLSSSLSILSLLILIPFTKASAHLACFGGLTGALFILNLVYHYNTSSYIPILFIVSGVVAWSRLELKAHSQNQLLLGFVIGFIMQFIGYLYFSS